MMTRRDEMIKVMQYFDENWPGHMPGSGFLAGVFKVTIETIRKDLKLLEEEGRIKRIKTDKYFTDYTLVK